MKKNKFPWIILGLEIIPLINLKFFLEPAFPSATISNWIITIFVAIILGIAGLGISKCEAWRSKQQAAQLLIARERILLEFAKYNKGVINLDIAPKLLNLSKEETDQLLTEWVKDPERSLNLEISNEGEIMYVFNSLKEDNLKSSIEQLEVEKQSITSVQ